MKTETNIKMNIDKIEQGVRLILEGLGEDPKAARLVQTPRRTAEMFVEVLSGTHHNLDECLKSLTEERHEEMVILKDIPIYSMCEHHLLPFSGTASIAYIPQEGKIMGLNTIAKLVDILAKRLQIQERLTKQIADYLVKAMSPLGVMVVIKAEHLCMTMRGAKKPGSTTITSAVRGIFGSANATRAEAMSLLMGREQRY
ncbi:MAG: GTP cyclohydrolase I FolE [Acidobacteria bacterium]|jgi:GTP cyclohydrolase I|nr:GTP cyclohydrolase I FolE [Acidobacteriota bacterium]